MSTQPAHLRGWYLHKKSEADTGIVERPILTPHFEFYAVNDQKVILVSENFNTLLNGEIYVDLLPMLDGQHARQKIIHTLSETHAKFDVQMALYSLNVKEYVVSGDYRMEHGTAAYWSLLGASPRWAEQSLINSTVCIEGDDGRVASQLNEMGITIDADNPDLLIVFCDDYLNSDISKINLRHIVSGKPWMMVRPNGSKPLFGPVFRPAELGPCWNCLAYRMRGHNVVHSYIREISGNERALRPLSVGPTILNAVCNLVSVEIAKWLVLKELAPLHENVISIDTTNFEYEHHRTIRRPQCSVCGDKTLYRSDRKPVPLNLKSSPKTFRTSGGIRSVTPEETIAKFRSLISPVSGVVTSMWRATDISNPWLHVYWACNNIPFQIRELSLLQKILRLNSAGKGSNAQQSEASALCESIERHSMIFHGDEIRCRRSYSDFVKAGDDEAIHPNNVQLFSERQLDSAKQINAEGHPLNIVPQRFDTELVRDWTPVWSFTQNRHLYLPTSVLYIVPPKSSNSTDLFADSNGCASGNTLEEAILQGFFELVERDSFAIWWYNQLQLPGVELESFNNEYLPQARDYYRRYSRDIWLLDATSDLGIPVFVCISQSTDTAWPRILYSAGAHLDPEIAALRAVCEMNQALYTLHLSEDSTRTRHTDNPLLEKWFKFAKTDDLPFLLPNARTASRSKSFYSVPDTDDLKDDVEFCKSLVEAKEMDFLVLDLTRLDVGMPVARVIVPGLRHFWPRFALGRLYDVPVEMRWKEKRITEDELNPYSVLL